MIQLGPDRTLTLENLRATVDGTPVGVSRTAYHRIDEAQAFVQRIVDEERVVYGITTGFGPLAGTYVDPRRSEELQRHLISHLKSGVGPNLSRDHTRAMMIARLSSVSKGHSGVRRAVIDLLAAMINEDIVPVVPAVGTVGASGDLTPLSYMADALQGVGDVVVDGEQMGASEALRNKGLESIRFGPKEAIALTNGTSAMAGIAGLNGYEFGTQLQLAIRSALLYGEVMGAKVEAFDPRVGEVRPHPGQIRVHTILNEALAAGGRVTTESSTTQRLNGDAPQNGRTEDAGVYSGGEIVQDPYSIRCIPQHYGACFDALDYHNAIVERELNAVTDNPLLFPEANTAIQAGNFYGQHVAFASDALVHAIIATAVHVERTIDRVTDPVRSKGLPPMLQPRTPGLQSGFMGAQVTATAILAEMRTRATPASIQSISTNAANQDIVTMGTIGARNAAWQIEQLWNLLAIQHIVLVQAAELRAAERCGETTPSPLADGPPSIDTVGTDEFSRSSRDVIAIVREYVPFLDEDRPLTHDIATLARALRRHSHERGGNR